MNMEEEDGVKLVTDEFLKDKNLKSLQLIMRIVQLVCIQIN